jgi:uncharacterized phage-associated protein
MTNVFDVAKYILHKHGSMSAMKLQKLVYYSQAWSLVWDEEPLFPEKICAWAMGPVVPDLYDQHRGMFSVAQADFQSARRSDVSTVQRETIDIVLSFYGDKPAQWLSDLTHMERPWKDARKGLIVGERSNREITHAAMAEYYGSLPTTE